VQSWHNLCTAAQRTCEYSPSSSLPVSNAFACFLAHLHQENAEAFTFLLTIPVAVGLAYLGYKQRFDMLRKPQLVHSPYMVRDTPVSLLFLPDAHVQCVLPPPPALCPSLCPHPRFPLWYRHEAVAVSGMKLFVVPVVVLTEVSSHRPTIGFIAIAVHCCQEVGNTSGRVHEFMFAGVSLLCL
jgi:hypothetical protein